MVKPKKEDIPEINLYQKQRVCFVVSDVGEKFFVELSPRRRNRNQSKNASKSSNPYIRKPSSHDQIYEDVQDETINFNFDLQSSIFLNIFRKIELSELKQACEWSIDNLTERKRIQDLADRDKLAEALVLYHARRGTLQSFSVSIRHHKPQIAMAIQREHICQEKPCIDVLIITAAPGEQEALLECVDFPAESLQNAQNSWQRKSFSNLKYYQKQFTYKDGRKITIASVDALDYGEIPAAIAATKFTAILNPSCLAIAGICAGYRKEVHLGDVIVAEKLFRANPGEPISDITTYKLKPDWYQQIKNYERKFDCIDWTYLDIKRPKSFEYQSHWLLHTLFEHQILNGASPKNHPDREKECPKFGEVIEFLEKDELLKWNPDGDLVLTEQALTKVRREKTKNILIVEPEFPRIWFRPVATGSTLLEGDDVFERIRKEQNQRYTCGYDMEGFSVAESAWLNNVERIIFVKAVSDYGDSQRVRNRHFRHYACKAAATFLIHFLKEHYLG